MAEHTQSASAPQNFQAVSNEIQNLFDAAYEQTKAACAIVDAARVLCALERSPEHHDTNTGHNIKTGGGFAHGCTLSDGTLPAILSHARGLIEISLNDFDVIREMAIDALNGGAQ
jgi:hypothetical protein